DPRADSQRRGRARHGRPRYRSRGPRPAAGVAAAAHEPRGGGARPPRRAGALPGARGRRVTSPPQPPRPLVGDRPAKALATGLGLHTVDELLRHYPRRYAERGRLTDLALLVPDEYATVLAEVASVHSRRMRQRRGSVLEVEVTDGTGRLVLT